MKMVSIKKAAPLGRGAVESVTIVIDKVIDEYRTKSYEELDKSFSDQAGKLEEALFSAIPGGVYDRILGLMLKRKSSHFIVPYGGNR